MEQGSKIVLGEKINSDENKIKFDLPSNIL